MASEFHHGHLRDGRVYRCLHNLDAKSYLVNYDPHNCILTDSLLTTELDGSAFTCELIQLTKNNILEFPIKEDDLDMIIKMEAGGHKDIMAMHMGDAAIMDGSSLPPRQIVEGIMRNFHSQEREDLDYVSTIASKLAHLIRMNCMQVDALNDVIDGLLAATETEPQTFTEALSRTNSGSGYNIGRALEHLQIYTGNDKRLSYDYNDLTMAIMYLIEEQVRRIYNDDL